MKYRVTYLKRFSYVFESQTLQDANRRIDGFRSMYPLGGVIILSVLPEEDPPPPIVALRKTK